PAVILAVLAAALVLNFWPNLTLPGMGPGGEDRVVETKLGLDLVGGLQVEYQALPAGGRSPDAAAMATIRQIVENRVNAQGVAEPVVLTQGTDRIVVELPGIADPDPIRQLLGQTGRLDFVPLPPERYGTGSAPGPNQAVAGRPLPTEEVVLFSGDQVDQAFATQDEMGLRAVGFRLRSDGARLFGDYTTANVNTFFAIVLDGTVVSAPVIQSAITGGEGIISGGGGGFSVTEMNSLITVLSYGSLPFPLQEAGFQAIGATLAGFSLDRILLAGFIATILIFLFMVVYYRVPGLVACLALLYYAIVVLAVFRLIPVTLTLAGLAGFVLSMGMAVDANVLIFERMKEELRLGKSLPAAMEAGFNRAWNSILDSNVSSLITATILYAFGSPTIRGFALVLIIGVILSMFTAITVTRTMLRGVLPFEWIRKPGLFGLRDEEFAGARGRAVGRGEARSRA
ncbi:MAG TPA: protein translocase subunit SecD, partial [Patescibacteria group bacterium]|nr:protein translocase subunit SecD [Patescibacteria group bacterium]